MSEENADNTRDSRSTEGSAQAEQIGALSAQDRVKAHQFKPGNPGRPPGIKNRRAKLVDAILDAIEDKTGDSRPWLKALPINELTSLVGKIVPREEKVEHDVPEGITFSLNIGTAGRAIATQPPALLPRLVIQGQLTAGDDLHELQRIQQATQDRQDEQEQSA